MKAIVHIGTEKTGTTSIQGFLYQNRKKLKSAGFHFIQSAGQTNNRILPAYCIGDDKHDDFYKEKGILTLEQRNEFKREFIREFEAEIHSVPKSIHTFIISSEHFHSRIRSAEEMDNVYRLLSTYFDEFKIICYLREQTTTCTSSYSTHMKTVGTESLDNFLLRCRPGNYYYNYHDLLANWERCFGFDALNVSIFAREHFLNGDLLDDFAAKIDPLLVGTLTRPARAENESLRPIGQALARAVNITFPANSSRAEAHALRERCKKVINDEFTGKGQQPTLGTQKRIYDSFIESNELVRQKFFPQLDILFPPPTEITQERYAVTEDDFQGIASIFNVLKRHGKGVLLDTEYAIICSTIFSCISEATEVVSNNEAVEVSGDEEDEGGSGVVFNHDDVKLLLRAARSIRGRDPKLAFKLASLADRISPNSPGIKKKMEAYRLRSEQAPKPQYIVTYQAPESSLDQDEVKQMKGELQSWLGTLDVPEGRHLTWLTGSSTVSANDTPTKGSESSRVGFSIFEAESMEAALTIAKKSPFLELGVTLEVSEFADLKYQ